MLPSAASFIVEGRRSGPRDSSRPRITSRRGLRRARTRQRRCRRFTLARHPTKEVKRVLEEQSRPARTSTNEASTAGHMSSAHWDDHPQQAHRTAKPSHKVGAAVGVLCQGRGKIVRPAGPVHAGGLFKVVGRVFAGYQHHDCTPTRFERVTFAFGGKISTRVARNPKRARWLRGGSLQVNGETTIRA